MHKDDFRPDAIRRYIQGTLVGDDPYTWSNKMRVKSILSTLESRFMFDIQQERERQKQLGWNDEHNTAAAWVCYIVNYASRWAMPASFDAEKYTFYRCMVKTAALCCAAAMWFLAEKDIAEIETVEQPQNVAEGVE